MDIFIIVSLGIFGAIIGSFLGCMGYRIPNKIKTTYPSSFCSSCKKPLKWYMNIPIISYIVQGGKCAYCKEKIGFIYFLTELLCASLFILNYCMFRFNLEFYISTIIVCVLVVTVVSDFKYYYISDRVLVIAVICLLITFLIFLNMNEVINRVVSAVIIFLLMFGIKILLKMKERFSINFRVLEMIKKIHISFFSYLIYYFLGYALPYSNTYLK